MRGVGVTPKVGRLMFQELAADVELDYKANRKKSLRDLQIRLHKHVLPFFRNRRASSIGTSDIQLYINNRKRSGASNAQVNRELAIVKRAFNLGRQAGKVIVYPHVPMLEENNVRQGFFEREKLLRPQPRGTAAPASRPRSRAGTGI